MASRKLETKPNAITPLKRLIIFDRDGTLIEHVHHLHRIHDVKLAVGAISTLSELSLAGFKFGMVTNQSVIERGIASIDDVIRINKYVADLFRKERISFDFIRFCPHMEDSGCSCRKPKLGMVQDLFLEKKYYLKDSYMIGDSISDVYFGNNLGVKPILIGNTNRIQERNVLVAEDITGILPIIQTKSVG